MAKIKEVQSTEVHWKVADWAIKDQANIRIRQLMGEDARFFAPVYVTHAGFYWSDPVATGWSVLTDASDSDRAEILEFINRLHSKALSRFPAQQIRIDHVFTRPNDDFVFYRRGSDGVLDVRLSGWGFANFKRAQGGPISDTPNGDSMKEVALGFSIDGSLVPMREFELFRGTSWAKLQTDAEGKYSLGALPPGRTIQVRDVLTGIERIEQSSETTSFIEIDVTEYLTVRIEARHDGTPVSGEKATVTYASHISELTLALGVAECRLPWLDGYDCKVSLRGDTQTRALDKETVNLFRFDFVTPRAMRTPVEVCVMADGEPVAEEPVRIEYKDNIRNLLTDSTGTARTEFDTPEDGSREMVTAFVREESASQVLTKDAVRFNFTFDTPPAEIFDGSVLVVDADSTPVAGYPINIKVGDESADYMTDDRGRVPLYKLVGGELMRVTDGTDKTYYRDYTLNPRQPEYVFQLPFALAPSEGDVTLRVIELNDVPSVGTTCVLCQGNTRLLAHLNERGEMYFDSGTFSMSEPVKVELFSSRRTFPPLQVQMSTNEKEYELREVDGPTPWWKIAGEIALAAIAGFFLLGLGFSSYDLFNVLPNFFA